MASVLVDHGAIVNYKKDGTSTWEIFLYAGLRRLIIGKAQFMNPDFVSLMNLFLASGVDRNVVIRAEGTSLDLGISSRHMYGQIFPGKRVL